MSAAQLFSQGDTEAAWASAFGQGPSHTGPLNDAKFVARNPYKTKESRDASPKSVTAEESTHTNEEIL